MKISVETGRRSLHKEIVSLLEQSELQAEFEGNDSMNPISLVFSVNIENEGEAIMKTEQLIRKQFGKALSFRVVPAGSIVYFK